MNKRRKKKAFKKFMAALSPEERAMLEEIQGTIKERIMGVGWVQVGDIKIDVVADIVQNTLNEIDQKYRLDVGLL